MRRFEASSTPWASGRIDVIATEAIRRATNGAELVAAIAGETGLEVRVLSGEEEAHYAALGVISGFFRPNGLVGDMGGGSLEIARSLTTGWASAWSACRSGRPAGAGDARRRRRSEAKRRIDALLKERCRRC